MGSPRPAILSHARPSHACGDLLSIFGFADGAIAVDAVQSISGEEKKVYELYSCTCQIVSEVMLFYRADLTSPHDVSAHCADFTFI